MLTVRTLCFDAEISVLPRFASVLAFSLNAPSNSFLRVDTLHYSWVQHGLASFVVLGQKIEEILTTP